MITKEQIKELAKKFLIDEYSILREYVQILFLSNLYSEKKSSEIYFKGGTAIRLLLNSYRFSEDLDFTSILKEESIEEITASTIKKMNLTLPVSFKRLKSIDKTFTGTISYNGELYKYPLNIHLDFSLREIPQTRKETVLETLFPISPYPIVIHMDWEEILSEKVRALITRVKGRDLFDIYYLLSKDIKIDLRLVNKKLEYYKKTTTKDDIIAKIKTLEEKQLTNDLNKYLPSTHRKMTSQLKELLIKRITNE